ncbi:MAG: HDOD domain-containing protein [Solidesulfovibrio sp. DCME]|uniref:HDOD domain-containing protein n=1 Tax=Solidesulfovibrio sp. DCME TaxID=3447380 RepID=UPI003D0AB4BA
MRLAEPLCRRDGALLLPEGVVLTQRHLQLFPVWNVDAAVVFADAPAPENLPEAPRPEPGFTPGDIEAAREALQPRFAHVDPTFPAMATLIDLAVGRAAPLLARRGPAALTLPGPIPEAALPPVPDTPPPGPMALIEADPKLTSLPDVFVRINEVLNDAHSTAKEAAEAIGKDTSLSTKLLKLVNSAFYGFPVKVDTLSRAVTIVGSRQLTTLALGISVIALFRDLPGGLVDMRSFWKHSIGCGVFASTLADPQAGGEVERLFVAGLLHDVGRLVLYRNVPRHAAHVLAAARRERILLREAERRVFGFDHATLAGMLLRKWRFPESLEKAVRHHHGGLAHLSMTMPATIHVADAITGALGIGSSGEIFAPPMSQAAWGAVGLPPDRLPDVTAASMVHIEDISQAFLGEEA